MILFILLKQFLEKAPLHLSNKWHVPPSRAHTHRWGESQMSSPGWFVLKQGPHTSTGLWVVLSLTYHRGEDFSTNPTLLETNSLFKIRVFLELLRGDGCVTYRDNGRVVIFFFILGESLLSVHLVRPSVSQSVCLPVCLLVRPSVETPLWDSICSDQPLWQAVQSLICRNIITVNGDTVTDDWPDARQIPSPAKEDGSS